MGTQNDKHIEELVVEETDEEEAVEVEEVVEEKVEREEQAKLGTVRTKGEGRPARRRGRGSAPSSDTPWWVAKR